MSRDYFRHIERHDSLNARKRECHGCASTHSSRKARRTRRKVQEVPIKNSSICRFVVGVAYPAMPKSLSPLVSLPRYAPSLTLSRRIIPNSPRASSSHPVMLPPHFTSTFREPFSRDDGIERPQIIDTHDWMLDSHIKPHPSARRRSSGPSSPLPQAREGSGRSRS